MPSSDFTVTLPPLPGLEQTLQILQAFPSADTERMNGSSVPGLAWTSVRRSTCRNSALPASGPETGGGLGAVHTTRLSTAYRRHCPGGRELHRARASSVASCLSENVR